MIRMRILAVSLTTLFASAALAQAGQALATDNQARWAGFLGCWEPAVRTGSDNHTQVCLLPAADGHRVRMLTFEGDQQVLSEAIVTDGTPQAANEKACAGQRSSRWAHAGPRFFSTSSLTCEGQPTINTTGITALISPDRWIDVQVAGSGGREQVRTRRFWRSSNPPPAAIADAVRALPPARTVVSTVNADDVIEASQAVVPIGVEAWLAESGARVGVDRRTLVRLADANVGANVIDLMVALAFPKKFEVRRSSSSGGGGGEGFFGTSIFDGFYPGVMSDLYGFGYDGFGGPYYAGYYGYGYPAGGFYYVPSDDGAPAAPHGQVVNGQGYTRVQPREPYKGTATQNGSSASASSSSGGTDSSNGSSGSSGSSGATPSGYSGGGGSSTGLTAVPR